ncbi:VWA3A [Symbiodinium natans]|uniref:VWA3A protein n=1 Tax=Symbiodinium natans TaxID=878477 RepID=A0A812N8K6_9DINO|nr:VWA3A [Symbiodinium natans]
MEPALCNREGLTKLQKQQLAAASRMRRTILAMGLAGGATLAKCAIACFLIGLLLQFLIAGRQLQQVSPPPSFCASKSPQGLASTSHLLSWKLDRFCRWWWFPFELTCPMVSMKLFVLALLFIHFHVLMVPRPGVLAAPELVGIMKRHPPSPYPMLPFTEWLLPGLSPETAKSWMESLCQLRSRMILCWFGFLLLPNWSHRAHINKGLQVAHGLLYGYGALIYAFFAAIHYAYTKKHSDYGGIVSVLAAIFAVPFLETNPMAGSWLRKFLIINAVIPIYLFAGICKVRYLGLATCFSGSWLTTGVMDRSHGYSFVPWLNKWLASTPPLIGTEPWTCLLLSWFTMFFEIIWPVLCIAEMRPDGQSPICLMFLVNVAVFHVMVFFQLGPNWIVQLLVVLLACDPLSCILRSDAKEAATGWTPTSGDCMRAVLGFFMMGAWFVPQLWSDFAHLSGRHPWNRNHEPYLPVPEMDMFSPASKRSNYVASCGCVVLLIVLLLAKVRADMASPCTRRPKTASKHSCEPQVQRA